MMSEDWLVNKRNRWGQRNLGERAGRLSALQHVKRKRTVPNYAPDGLCGPVARALVAAMSGRQRETQHLDPVWRDRSDFIIAADISSQGTAASREQLWVRQISDTEFELCCIPFFLYDVALGDVVETETSGPRKYVISRVVKPSGRYVFRAWFGESFQPRDEVAEALEALGALLEWSSRNLLAIDSRDAGHAQVIADFLAEREAKGHLVYETGKII